MDSEDPAHIAGYRFVSQLANGELRLGVVDYWIGPAPLWHRWAIREAFWAGVEWERKQQQQIDEGGVTDERR